VTTRPAGPTWSGPTLAGVVLVVGAVLGACGGRAANGTPASLSLGGTTVATADVEQQLGTLCPVLSRAGSDPGGAETPFYAGPHGALHVLTAVLASGHRVQSDAMLKSMLSFEQALTARSPSAGQAGAALLATVNDGQRALRIPVTTC